MKPLDEARKISNSVNKCLAHFVLILYILQGLFIISFDNFEVQQRLCEYVVENIDDKLTVETVADKFGFSSSYLGKLFKQKTGEGFVYFITTVKMEKAKILIRSGKYKNYEISDILGYKSPDYFCSLFKTHTNMTPADYKKSIN
jgi:two-component system response regulator YesN